MPKDSQYIAHNPVHNCKYNWSFLSFFIQQRSVRELCEKIGSFLHEVCKAEEESGRLVH